MTDDRTADDTRDQEGETPPELADWWVWGVRRVAAVIADLLLAARFIPLLFAVLKGATWAFTRDPNELWGAGAAMGGFVALWGGGMLLRLFRAVGLAGSRALAVASSPREARVTDRHPASGAAESGRSPGIVSQAMAGMAGVKCISPTGPVMMSVMLSAKV